LDTPVHQGSVENTAKERGQKQVPSSNVRVKRGRGVKNAKPNSVKLITFLIVKSKQALNNVY
jgi:hypothetical protein